MKPGLSIPGRLWLPSLLLLLLLALLLPVGCKRSKATEAPARSMTSLTESERRQKFEEDLALIRRYDEGLRHTLSYAAGRPDLFPNDESIVLDAQQKHELRVIWQAVLDYMRALDGVKGYWKEFYRFKALGERRAHGEAFLVSYAAWLVQYRHGLAFIDLTVPSRTMEKLLDEAAPRYEIPADAFAALKWNVIRIKAITRLLGSQQYYRTVEPMLRDVDCHAKAWCNWAMATVDRYPTEAVERLKMRGVIEFGYNAFDLARDRAFDAWFPIQRNVAEWLGDTRVRRLHQHLISAEQLADLRAELEPGDIIVARHNWYLSNIGLPGFWPHAELYLGSPDELAAYFDEPEVREYFEAYLGVEDVVAHLRQTAPRAWETYAADAADGHPHRVIEAISEGVVFSSLERAAGADYVGVMRPKRSKVEKAIAIARAFGLFGRPYDFNFDFVTDEELVCTELVYKSWQPTDHGKGLSFELQEVMGRQTLPANDLVRQFDARFGRGDLGFVYFLDGREKEGRAIVGSLDQFRRSWKRPKWDAMQQ